MLDQLMTLKHLEPARFIDADDSRVEQALTDLAHLVDRHDGWFDPGLTVESYNGSLRITGTPIYQTNSRLPISIPERILPPINAFKFSYRDQEITIEEVDDRLSSAKTRSMEKMVTIYNAGDQAEVWRRISPFLTLAKDHALKQTFLWGRSLENNFLSQDSDKLTDGDVGEAVVSSFLKSRMFLLNSESYSASVLGEQRGSVLMPFIDFVNHHINGKPFNLEGAVSGNPRLVLNPQKAVPGSSERFARYNFLDNYSAFAHYGFIDRSANFTISVPVTLQPHPDIRIEAHARSGHPYRGNLPPKIRDLGMFIPQMENQGTGVLSVQRLIIPGTKAPKALRRVLALLIGQTVTDPENYNVNRMVATCEQQLLEQNLAFYQDLQERVATARATTSPSDVPGRMDTLDRLDELARINMDHIANYKALNQIG